MGSKKKLYQPKPCIVDGFTHLYPPQSQDLLKKRNIKIIKTMVASKMLRAPTQLNTYPILLSAQAVAFQSVAVQAVDWHDDSGPLFSQFLSFLLLLFFFFLRHNIFS